MFKMILVQIDVVRSYLESAIGQNKQPIYMRISRRCIVGRERLIYKLLKSLYRLKQAVRFWNKTLIKFCLRIGFTPTNVDVCIFITQRKRELIIIEVYLDNLILRSLSTNALECLKNQFIKEFNMKDLGEVKTIIE